MKLKDYLMLKQAFNTLPMPGPTQYIPKNTSTTKSSSTPNSILKSTLKSTPKSTIRPSVLSRKPAYNKLLFGGGTLGGLSGGTAGYRVGPIGSLSNSELFKPSPQDSHSATLLAKIRHLDKLQREEVDKHWNSTDYWTTADGKPTPKWDKYNRKRHNALRYLENIDNHEYWRYLHDDLGMNYQ